MKFLVFDWQVNQLDLNSLDKFFPQYLGIRHEIAKKETLFEKGMDWANAAYSLRDDDKIDVLNAGKFLKCLEITVKIFLS